MLYEQRPGTVYWIDHYVVGTNGRILFAANSFNFDLKQSVIIPDSKFLAWNGFLTEDGCQLAVQHDPKNAQAGWVQLRTPRWTYTAKQIEGNYPNWKNAVPARTEKGTTLRLSPEAIAQIISVVPQLPGGDNQNRPVRLSVQTGELHLEARQKEDSALTRVRIDGAVAQGPAITASLNRDLLAQALRYGLNQIDLETPDDVMVFSQGGRKCVVKLLNQSPPTPAPASGVTKPTETSTPEERKVVTKETKTEPQEPLKLALERIEAIREALKTTVRDLGEVADALKAAEKEKKTAAREVESVRTTLRSLQKLAI